MDHVELSRRAERDLRRIGPGPQLDPIVEALEDLMRDPPLPNLDIKPLSGRAPWRRLRVGDHRVLFRPLTGSEMEQLRIRKRVIHREGILVERVVHRRDLERAVGTL